MSRKYFVVLRSVPDKQQPPSREEMQQIYARFESWCEKFKSNIVDLGGRLKPGGKILTTAGVTDGPFTEAKEVIGGYMVVTAENFDGAIQVKRTSAYVGVGIRSDPRR